MSQRRDRAGRYARGAVAAPAPAYRELVAFTPTVEKAEQARVAGMRGLYRRHLDRAAEILDGEAERGGDENLRQAVDIWRRVRARDFVAAGEKETARLTLTLYTGGDEPVSKAAGIAVADLRRR